MQSVREPNKADMTVASTESVERPWRLVILNSHPIQYFAPLYRKLAAEPQIHLTVYYCSLQGASEYNDAGFGAVVRWDTPLLEGYDWKLLPNAGGAPDISHFWGLRNYSIIRTLAATRPDAILIHGHNYATNVLALAAARLLGVPVLMRGETHLGLYRSTRRRAARSIVVGTLYRRMCALCLPIGTSNHEFYRSLGIPENRLVRAPYSVDNEYFASMTELYRSERDRVRRTMGVGPRDTLFLFASKFIARKRPTDILRAYQQVSRTRNNVALALVGSGSDEAELRRYAADQRLERVHFLGFRNQSELPELYAASDVFVLPSENEPWGLVINEAMASGLPIVASREIGAVPDLVRDGINGFTFPAGDVLRLANALGTLADNAALRTSMGAESRAVISHWGLEETVAGIRRALDIVSPRRPVASSAEGIARK